MLVILIILVLLYYAVGWCCQVCMGTLNICDWFIAWKHWSYHWEVVHSILKHSRNYHYALHVVNEIGNVAEQIKIYWTTFFGNILACILHVCRSSCNFLGFTYVKLLWPNDYMMDDYMWMQACRQYSGKSYSLAGMLFEWRRCSDAWQIFFYKRWYSLTDQASQLLIDLRRCQDASHQRGVPLPPNFLQLGAGCTESGWNTFTRHHCTDVEDACPCTKWRGPQGKDTEKTKTKAQMKRSWQDPIYHYIC